MKKPLSLSVIRGRKGVFWGGLEQLPTKLTPWSKEKMFQRDLYRDLMILCARIGYNP